MNRRQLFASIAAAISLRYLPELHLPAADPVDPGGWRLLEVEHTGTEGEAEILDGRGRLSWVVPDPHTWDTNPGNITLFNIYDGPIHIDIDYFAWRMKSDTQTAVTTIRYREQS